MEDQPIAILRHLVSLGFQPYLMTLWTVKATFKKGDYTFCGMGFDNWRELNESHAMEIIETDKRLNALFSTPSPEGIQSDERNE